MIDKKVVALLIGKKNSTGFPGKMLWILMAFPLANMDFKQQKVRH